MIITKYHVSLNLNVPICRMGMIPQGNVQRIRWETHLALDSSDPPHGRTQSMLLALLSSRHTLELQKLRTKTERKHGWVTLCLRLIPRWTSKAQSFSVR